MASGFASFLAIVAIALLFQNIDCLRQKGRRQRTTTIDSSKRAKSNRGVFQPKPYQGKCGGYDSDDILDDDVAPTNSSGKTSLHFPSRYLGIVWFFELVCGKGLSAEDTCYGHKEFSSKRFFYDSTLARCDWFCGCVPSEVGNNFGTLQACSALCGGDAVGTTSTIAATTTAATTTAVATRKRIRKRRKRRTTPATTPAAVANPKATASLLRRRIKKRRTTTIQIFDWQYL